MKKLTYKMTVAGLERELPICPLTDDISIAGFVIFGDPEVTTAAAKQLLELAPEYDYILTAESKGIPLAHEMSRIDGNRRYFLARKAPKLYMQDVFSVVVHSITTFGEQKLYMDRDDAETMRGKKILIVDDVISTGESLHGLETLAAEVGANVVGKMCILTEGAANDRPDIIHLGELPIFDPEGNPIG